MKNSSGVIRARQLSILEYIRSHNYAEVTELSEVFSVSSVTIRKDLDLLAQQGKIIRTFGGGEYPKTTLSPLTTGISPKDHSLLNAETEILFRQIARKAASFIQNGDTVFLNNSSLAVRILEFIDQNQVTVVTNRLESLQVIRSEHISLVLTGGSVNRGNRSLAGAIATDTIMKFYASCCFLGIDQLDPLGRFSGSAAEDAYWNHRLVQQTEGKVVALIPPEHMNAALQFLSSDLTAVTDIITASGADTNPLSALEAGIAVHMI